MLVSAFSSKLAFRGAGLFILLLGLAFWLKTHWPVDLSIYDAITAMGCSIPFMTLSVLTAGLRLSWLCGPPVSLGAGVGVNAVAQLVVLLVPSRISEAAKPVGLLLVCDFPLSRGFTVLTIERLIDAGMLAFLVLLSLMFASGPFDEQFVWSGFVLAALAIAGGVMVLIVGFCPQLLNSLKQKFSARIFAENIDYVVRQFVHLSDPKMILFSFSLSAVTWVSSYLVLLTFFSVALDFALDPSQVLVVFIASTIGLIVSVAPGGLGTFEAAVALSLAAFGIEAPDAVTAAVLLRITLVLPVLALAGWYLWSSPLGLGEVLKGVRNRNPNE